MSAIIALLAAFGPGVLQYLAGPKAGAIASSVMDIAKTVTGTDDLATAKAVAEADPVRATELRVQLAKIAADAAAAERKADLDMIRGELADVASARNQTVRLAEAGSLLSWAAAIISIVILSGFYLSPLLARWLQVAYSPSWEGVQQAGYTAVIAYWIGASASGRRAQEANQRMAADANEAANTTVNAAVQVIRHTPAQVVMQHQPAAPLPPPQPWKRFADDGLGWRVSADGVTTEDDPEPMRTVGEPVTVTRIWQNYGALIGPMAEQFSLPATVVVMVIATESGGKPAAYRKEPDGRESSGLGQALTGTASEIMGRAISVADLRDPALAIEVTCRYLQRQAAKTGLDPILAAAGYNAGSLVYSPANRWRLRSTEGHLDRSARYFGDACAVAARDGWA